MNLDEVTQLITVEHNSYPLSSSIGNYDIHLYKIGYICYFNLFLDKNITDGTILSESVSLKYQPKNIVGWKKSLYIHINNNTKHFLEFDYGTGKGKITYKNPEANSCWGEFERFWFVNSL